MDFLKNNTRFSFLYGGKDAFECSFTKNIKENENEIITEYIFEDSLKVTNIAKYYPKYDAYEWVNWLENIGNENTQVISELWDCDCEIPFKKAELRPWVPKLPDTDKITKIYAPQGANWSAQEFFSDPHEIKVNVYENLIFLNDSREYGDGNGRSSGGDNAPFFNVHQDGMGAIMAVGWTGQWKSKITRNEDTVRFQSKVEDTEFILYPGEKIRTSSVVLMNYKSDFEGAQNKWRRLIKDEFSIIGKRVENVPLSAMIWGGMKSDEVMRRIDRIAEKKIPIEYIWMDAGWYGADTKPSPNEYEGDWYEHTGDWRISSKIHPEGLLDVAKRIKDNNRKFLLWVEPERCIKTTPKCIENPEYFIFMEGEGNTILNLGNPDALEYCIETISGLIKDLDLKCYRQDFNVEPLPFWRKNDSENRRGITEIKHIMGLYKFWDTILERFPDLIIDNCAGGGRRIDIETLRRSVPLWRSDAQCPSDPVVEITQAHNMNHSLWYPYSATGCGRVVDTYRVRSSYAGGMGIGYFYSAQENFAYDDEACDWLKGICEEYLKIRPYFYGDIYHLTKPTADETTWAAVQWDRPENGDGMVQVTRREYSPYTESVFMLKGIKPDKNYIFTDLDGGEFTLSGKDIAENGFCVKIPEVRTAKIFIYKEA